MTTCICRKIQSVRRRSCGTHITDLFCQIISGMFYYFTFPQLNFKNFISSDPLQPCSTFHRNGSKFQQLWLGVSMWKWVLASELEGNTDVTNNTRDFVKQRQSPKIFFFTWEKNITNARTGFKRNYLNVTSKSENVVSLPKLESGVTQRDIKGHIKSH